ncbi:MAG: type II toxin-antitoxin system VapC family toxin [Solirubrobacterales bacterium]|nr:type II toxin-antitoxin system VapC family toxin [Solirubrobacterales bacterium]
MLVYLDSSAIVKRVVLEEHSQALRERLSTLEAGANELLTSTLGWIEVSRTLQRRLALDDLGSSGDFESRALTGVAGFPMSYEVVGVARRIGTAALRSLDAVHCATATVAQADLLITYDKGLASAASSIGLTVESPGAEA